MDRDSVDEVFEELGVSVDLDGLRLSFGEMEDFHPDRIYERIPAFQDSSQFVTRTFAATAACLTKCWRMNRRCPREFPFPMPMT